MIFLHKAAYLIGLIRFIAGVALVLGFAQLVESASAAQTNSEFYSGLAEQSRETAASARRTAAGERENASRARENARNWRDLADEARELGQEDNARTAEDRAARAENDATEADAAANRAARRAQIAEREARGFDEKAGQAGATEARERHAAVLVDPNTVFHRLYIIGSLEEGVLRDTLTTDINDLQQCLEGAGSQAAGSTTTTLVTPTREELRTTLERMQRLAVPGDEVTFSYAGHGGGGPFWGGRDLENEDNEEYDEHLNINDNQSLRDDELATWLRGFAPGVTITVLLNSCFGGGFTGGGTDIQENNSVNVIGVGNTCPGTGRTLIKDAIRGCGGAADYDADGIITAVELENFLRAEGWDIRAPYDNSSDISAREQIEIWGDDLQNWWRGALVKPPAEESVTAGYLPGVSLSYDSPVWCTYGGGETPVPVSGPPVIALGSPTTDGPVSTPGTPPVTRVPDTEVPTAGTPPEAPEEDTPGAPTFTLTIKAQQTVLEDGKTKTVAVPEAMIKLDIGAEPELPIAGNERDDSGFSESPIQGLTDAEGTLVLVVPASQVALIPASYSAAEVEVDLTIQSGTVVKINVDRSKENWDQPTTYLHPDLHEYITQSYLLDGSLVVALQYPKERTGAVNELIGLSSNVEYAEVNYCRDKQLEPNDPYFASKGSWGQSYDDQWAIKRVGFTADRDSAWRALGNEPKPVVVAVIDTGLDWNHHDIAWDSIWNNEDEIPGNGIDDDDNGYVDDLIGWDFWRNTNKPFDRDGHGTFVTGVIAATHDNGVGIAGINPHARIMVLKALNNFGHTRASYLAEAIIYAANNGARVINLSVGGKNLTRTEKEAIDYAHSKGAVIVVAAGNEGINVDEYGVAALNHVITVATTDIDDKRAVFSNWGASIDIAAPGMDVLGPRARRTDLLLGIPGVKYTAGEAFVGPDKRYYRASGTSFSVPIVAGAASVILSRYPELTNAQVKRMLLHSAKDIEVPGWDQLTGYGLLDTPAALSADLEFFVESRIDGVKAVKKKDKLVVEVSGTVDSDRFKRAWIEIGKGKDPKTWKKVSRTIKKPVRKSVLDDLNAKNFRGAKEWTLRLIIEHKNGARREARFNLKLG